MIKTNPKKQGFTLVELIIGIAVLGILLLIAAPALVALVQKKQTEQLVEQIHEDIKLAHATGMENRTTFYVSFVPGASGTTWCYGLSDTANCNCTTLNNCQVGSVTRVISYTQFPNTTLTLTGFSGTAANPYIQIDGVHGTLLANGSMTITEAGNSVVLSVDAAGLVTECSTNGTILEYPKC